MTIPYTPFETKIQTLLNAAIAAYSAGNTGEAKSLITASERYITMAKQDQPLHPDILDLIATTEKLHPITPAE